MISPPPDSLDEVIDSSVKKPSAREVRLMLEARERLEKVKRIKRYIWGTAGVVVLSVTITASTLVFGKDAIDAGAARAVEPVAKDVKRLEDRVDKLEPALQQQALEQARTGASIDMLLRKEGIRPLPPVPPLLGDGGK